MPRSSRYEVVTDTHLWNALQLQPRAAMTLGFGAFAHWMKDHWVSYSKLITEHHFGVVFLGVTLDYDEPLGCFDADTLAIESRLRALRGGTRLRLDVEIHGVGRRAAQLSLLMCPVAITEHTSLGAEPATLSDRLLGYLHADEQEPGSPERTVPAVLADVAERGRRLGSAVAPFVVHRHLCEVADQWFFAEIPGLVETTRETLALSPPADASEESRAALRRLVGQPLRSCALELSRPYFWRHAGEVRTEAYALAGETLVVHQLRSTAPSQDAHGVVIERF